MYEKKRILVRKKKSSQYNFTLKTLRFTDTRRALVKEAQDVKRHFYKLLLHFLQLW